MKQNDKTLNWRKAPFIRLLIFFILGIIFNSYLDLFSPFVYLILSIFFLLLLSLTQIRTVPFKFKNYIGILISILFFIVGALSNSHTKINREKTHLIHLEEDEYTFIAKVNEDKTIQEKVKTELNLIGYYVEGVQYVVSGKVLSYFELDDQSERIKYGDILQVKMKASLIKSNQNPYSFNFKRFNEVKGIHHQGFVKDWTLIQSKQSLVSWIINQRSKLLDILKKHIPSKNEFSVGAAICLGAKSHLSDDLKNAYAATGAMHVLAVSGLHVGIIFSLLSFIFSFFKSRKVIWRISKTILIIITIWSYAILTGGSASVMRAALMFTFISIAINLFRGANIYNTIAVAAFTLLLIDPNLIFDVGFQLSFSAILGIIYFQPAIYECLDFDWQVPDYLWKISSVGIAAQIATFPIGLYYFNQFPIYFLLTGFFVVPLAYIILSTGIAIFLIDPFIPVLANLLGKLLYGLIWINNSFIHLVHQLPGEKAGQIFIGGLGLSMLYLMLFLLSQYIKSVNPKWLLLSLSLMLCMFIFQSFQTYHNNESSYLCVYHSSTYNLIDLSHQGELYVIRSRGLSQRKEDYAAEKLRKYHGLNADESTNGIAARNNIFFVKNKKIGIQNNADLPKEKTKLDYLILTDNVNLSIPEINQSFDFENIVFATSNNYKTIKNWIEECNSLGISFHNVKSDGAFYKVF